MASELEVGKIKAGDGTTTAIAGADDVIIAQSSGDAGVTIRTATSSTGQICFADGNTGNEAYRGFIGYAHGTDKLNLGSGGSTALSIDSTGLATFSNGINLGDTTLSNYAEGTWTPTAGGDSSYASDGSGGYLQFGRYTRIGRLVTATFDMTINTRTGSSYVVSGLPFSAGSDENIGAGGSIIYYSGLAVSPVNFSPTVSGSTIHIRSATAAAASPSNHGLIAAGSRIAGIVTYTV
jgi:hypothetical protein